MGQTILSVGAIALGLMSACILLGAGYLLGYLKGTSPFAGQPGSPAPQIFGRKNKGARHKPKSLNEEQLAKRERIDYVAKGIPMDEQEGADREG